MPTKLHADTARPHLSKRLLNTVLRSYLSYRFKRIERFMQHPVKTQDELLESLLQTAARTEWGRRFDYSGIRSRADYIRRVPLQVYEDLQPFIHQMMMGTPDVLWPGITKWFAKSSGTTNDKSKFIPVTEANLETCHIQGGWDSVVLFYQQRPDAAIFMYKNIILPGSISSFPAHPETQIGDISALMIANMPAIGRPFYVPSREIALLPSWEEKIEQTVRELIQKNDIGMFGGVPTWNLVLFRRILEVTGKSHLLELWPHLQVYFHGGVGFSPYREQFKKLIPSDRFSYMEIYNASEGFFAIQNDLDDEGMLLLLDNGMYYEFIPFDEIHRDQPKTISLGEVRTDTDYELVLTTNSGLWRYRLGDTIRFTSLQPYKIIITGRTKQYINIFGEEVMIHNTDRALAETCAETGAVVYEYTVGPRFMQSDEKGGHHWVIEFTKPPADLEDFAQRLDRRLQSINTDYAAKRTGDLALTRLQLSVVPPGTFVRWMQARKRAGAQNKVPRLSNSRKYVESILNFAQLS